MPTASEFCHEIALENLLSFIFCWRHDPEVGKDNYNTWTGATIAEAMAQNT